MPQNDAAEHGVWSGSTLFTHRNFYQNYDKNEKSTPDIHQMKKWTRPIDKDRRVHSANVG